MQHPDKTHAIYIWKNNWNIENKNLQRTCTTIATYATYRYTFATFTWYTCDIQMKHLKHLKHTFTTRVSNAQCHLTPWTNHGAQRHGGAWSSLVRLWARTWSVAWVSTCSRRTSTPGQAPAPRPGPDGGVAGDGGGGNVPEWPGRVAVPRRRSRVVPG
jgi:hypothetical protein